MLAHGHRAYPGLVCESPAGFLRWGAVREVLRRWFGRGADQPGCFALTARAFPTSALAYYWAKEKELLGVEVILAFDDSRWDVVTMRL